MNVGIVTLIINRPCSLGSFFLSIYCEVTYCDYCYCTSLICFINIIDQLFYIRNSLIIWSTNEQVILQIYSFLVAFLGAGTLLVIIIFIGCLVGPSDQWWFVRGNFYLAISLCLLKTAGHRVRLPWAYHPKQKELSYRGDSGRIVSNFASLPFFHLSFTSKYKLCDNKREIKV